MKRLVMALDYKKNKKNPAPYTRTSLIGKDGVWRLCESGDGFINTYELSELSEKEVEYLKTIQVETPCRSEN